MGFIRHHAILVTHWDLDKINDAHSEAIRNGLDVSGISVTEINGYATFCVFPDGSKEGWPESENGDIRRDAFVAWLRSQESEPGYPMYGWAELCYGSDDAGATLTRHGWSPLEATP